MSPNIERMLMIHEVVVVKGFSLEIGDIIEYAGTSHDYSMAAVTDIENLASWARRVSLDCGLPGHGAHSITFIPETGYVRKLVK